MIILYDLDGVSKTIDLELFSNEDVDQENTIKELSKVIIELNKRVNKLEEDIQENNQLELKQLILKLYKKDEEIFYYKHKIIDLEKCLNYPTKF